MCSFLAAPVRNNILVIAILKAQLISFLARPRRCLRIATSTAKRILTSRQHLRTALFLLDLSFLIASLRPIVILTKCHWVGHGVLRQVWHISIVGWTSILF